MSPVVVWCSIAPYLSLRWAGLLASSAVRWPALFPGPARVELHSQCGDDNVRVGRRVILVA